MSEHSFTLTTKKVCNIANVFYFEICKQANNVKLQMTDSQKVPEIVKHNHCKSMGKKNYVNVLDIIGGRCMQCEGCRSVDCGVCLL